MLLANNSGGSSQKEYVDSLFSTYLYTGNGSTQTINNGVDLDGKGGLVWIKFISDIAGHALISTEPGRDKILQSNTNGAAFVSPASYDLTSFNSTGFSVGPAWNISLNNSLSTYVSWTFRKAPKFFDVVTYTGNGVAGRQIAHSLGVAPGMVIVKKTNTSSNWMIYHKDAGNGFALEFNTDAKIARDWWNYTTPTSTHFTVAGSTSPVNASGDTYVAYLFAHDPSADGIIQCGSFTGNTTVNIGWEPQWIMIKRTDAAGDWIVIDSIRGCSVGGVDAILNPNLANAESVSNDYIDFTATGFITKNLTGTYIYTVIRRPNKTPTTGTQVYTSSTTSGVISTGFPVDLHIGVTRAGDSTNHRFHDRLRGGTKELISSSTAAESTVTDLLFDSNSGLRTSFASGLVNHFFKRAPGFFSTFAYTGNGSNTTQNHDLAAIPDLLIIKFRSAATDWQVWCNGLAANEKLVLNSNAAKVTDATAWNSTLPTSTNISLGTASATNANTATFIAYAFSNLPGIQKIGTYVGDGTSGRVIDCGFSTGARLVCIKAISTTGSWLVSDSARGIVSGNDPYLQLNSTAAEVTTEDWLDPASIGFIVNNVTSSNANTSGVTYMYWAIA